MNKPKPSTGLEGLGMKTIEKNCNSIVARISPPNKLQKSQLSYGSCSRCRGAIAIPGVDHCYCPTCNDWIPDPVWAKSEVIATAVKAEIKAKRGRKKANSLTAVEGVA